MWRHYPHQVEMQRDLLEMVSSEPTEERSSVRAEARAGRDRHLGMQILATTQPRRRMSLAPRQRLRAAGRD